MNDQSNVLEAILIDCLRAMDAGASVEACLARYKHQADSIRPHLEFRVRLLALEKPEPAAAAYEAGRQALLERVLDRPARASAGGRSAMAPVQLLFRRKRLLSSPIARLAAVAATLAVLGLSALGASAASGVGPARDVLSTLHLAPPSNHEAPAGATGLPAPSPQSDSVGSGRPIPGVGICFDEGALDHPPDLPDQVLQRVPGAGLCVPDGLLEHSAEGRACVPAALLKRFPQLHEFVGESATCGASADEQAGQDLAPQQTAPAPSDGREGPTPPASPTDEGGSESRLAPDAAEAPPNDADPPASRPERETQPNPAISLSVEPSAEAH